jgi:hypothetical protein
MTNNACDKCGETSQVWQSHASASSVEQNERLSFTIKSKTPTVEQNAGVRRGNNMFTVENAVMTSFVARSQRSYRQPGDA